LQAQEKAQLRAKVEMTNKTTEKIAMAAKISSRSKAKMLSRFKSTTKTKGYYELDDALVKALLKDTKEDEYDDDSDE